MHSKIAKEAPLSEVTLRKYERPANLQGRALVRKFCLSLGLLQPGDSRDVIVDVFHAFLLYKQLDPITLVQHVTLLREQANLSKTGIAASNIRRQLKRLKQHYLIERVGNIYRFTENAHLTQLFEEKIREYHLFTIAERVKEYCQALDKEFKQQNSTSVSL